MTNLRNILFAILILAFALRVAGVGHGLPLLVVDDEPPFVFSALKMLELKTLVLHGENFKDILYYPPYLAYALLPFFAVLAGLLFFRFGSLELLKTYVAADPSLFFLTARIVTAALGVLSVYLIYRFARNIWKTEAPALWAAFFTATSLLAISLSSVARHWTAVLFLFSLVLFFLSHTAWTARKRYALSLFVAGTSFGVVGDFTISLLALIALWFFFCECDESRWKLLKKYWLPSAIVLGFFYKLPLWLYPIGMGFKAETILKAPYVVDVLIAPFAFGYSFFVSEPIFALAVFAGMWIALRNYKRFFCLSACFAYLYALLFLIFFRYEARFFLPLIPLFSALAGLAFSRIRMRVSIPAALLIIFLSARLALLAWGGDTRELARAWVDGHIPEKSRIATYGKGLRLPKTKEAFAEQAVLDASSLRSADRADESLSESTRSARRYHALNLYALQNDKLWSGITEYLARNDYQFLAVSEDGGDDSRVMELKKTGDAGALIQVFSGSYTDGVRYTDADFKGGFPALFRIRALGPDMILYMFK